MNIFNTDAVRSKTVAHRDTAAVTDLREQVQLTDKQIAIRDAVNKGSWGCQDKSVRALVQAITGVECASKDDDDEKSEFIVGTLIVDAMGDTFLVRGKDNDDDARIMTKDGSIETDDGNEYILRSSDWRYATDAEIDAFFA